MKLCFYNIHLTTLIDQAECLNCFECSRVKLGFYNILLTTLIDQAECSYYFFVCFKEFQPYWQGYLMKN